MLERLFEGTNADFADTLTKTTQIEAKEGIEIGKMKLYFFYIHLYS